MQNSTKISKKTLIKRKRQRIIM